MSASSCSRFVTRYHGISDRYGTLRSTSVARSRGRPRGQLPMSATLSRKARCRGARWLANNWRATIETPRSLWFPRCGSTALPHLSELLRIGATSDPSQTGIECLAEQQWPVDCDAGLVMVGLPVLYCLSKNVSDAFREFVLSSNLATKSSIPRPPSRSKSTRAKRGPICSSQQAR